MKFNPFDVVVVPFPFSDSPQRKKRPAVVISSSYNSNHIILLMITSALHYKLQLDIHITDIKKAGLPKECIMRMKLFTIDTRLIQKQIGTLGEVDSTLLKKNLKKIIPYL